MDERIIKYYINTDEVRKSEWYDRLQDGNFVGTLSIVYELPETVESLKKRIEDLEKEVKSLKLEKEIRDKIDEIEPITIPNEPYDWRKDRYPWYPNIIYCENADWTVRPENLPQYSTSTISDNSNNL